MIKLPKIFPSISRFITERISFKPQFKAKTQKIYSYISIFLIFLVIIILLILTGFVGYKLSIDYFKYQDLQYKRQQGYSKINFWKSIAEKYNGYPEAYFNIAVLYYELGDLNHSQNYLIKTLLLNPDYPNADKLKKKLK